MLFADAATLALLSFAALASVGAAITAANADNQDPLPAVCYAAALLTLAYIGLFQ